MPLLLTAAVFVFPLACAYTTAASDPIPTTRLQLPTFTLSTAYKLYINITTTADNPVASTDAPCSTGEFVAPRLGCWPSSGLRSLDLSQSFEPTTSPATPPKPLLPMFTYDPATTQPAEPTSSKRPTGDPDKGTGGHEQVGAIPRLWITVAIYVAVFLGWAVLGSVEGHG